MAWVLYTIAILPASGSTVPPDSQDSPASIVIALSSMHHALLKAPVTGGAVPETKL